MSVSVALQFFLPAVAIAMGACIGSFLNVVIYRLPRGMRVDRPTRSFCPHCGKTIPAWLNIPLVTWVMLRGKCRWCREEIPFRYFLVEGLTAICFLAIWQLYFVETGILGVVALWVAAAVLIGSTFIDIDHLIIPDSLTLGGLGAGLLFSMLVPALHGAEGWWQGLLASVRGAALGFAILWAVVMLGKLLFGQIRHEFSAPVEFSISQPGGEDQPILISLGPETTYEWGDVFYRSWDRMDMEVTELAFDGEPRVVRDGFRVFGEKFEVDGESIPLEEVRRVTGKCSRAVIPREAMGFGDVKFLAMIGAFLGWKAVLLTLMAGCLIGALIGSVQKVLSRESKLPFGPYLALGAFLWIFAGEALWNWYSALWLGGSR